MTTLPLREVKDHLSQVVNSVDRTHERFTLTRNGRPVAVLISPDDLESLQETIEVLADTELVRQHFEGLAALRAGDAVDEAEMADMMRAAGRLR